MLKIVIFVIFLTVYTAFICSTMGVHMQHFKYKSGMEHQAAH